MSDVVTHEYEGGSNTTTVKRKPGITTTEFWLTVAAAIVSFVVGQGFISDEQTAAVVSAIGPVVAAFGYNLSRGSAKKGAA